MKLRLSPDLFLPATAITQTFGILAVRGAGKSNLAAVMAEEMFAAGLPFVVVDPVGNWWGLRSSADGQGAGLAVPIFGGRHGDVPLEKTGGQLLADLVVDKRLSCVLDVSELSEGDKIRFLIDFAERLYRKNQDPLHLFLEEADDYCPQRPFREQARLLRAWENVVRRGRSRGLGMTMITQRSAALNKNVLTQIETLFVLRTTSPQDRKAIQAWVEYHGQSQELLDSLPSLGPGEAWAWSPQWLGVLKRTQIRRRSTFDSGATPKDLKGRRPVTTLADVDLGSIQKEMAATIDRAKAEDPRELRRRIQELERQLREKPASAAPREKRVEVQVLEENLVARLERAILAHAKEWLKALDKSDQVQAVVKELQATIAAARRGQAYAVPTGPAHIIRLAKAAQQRLDAPRPPENGLGAGERRILTAIAQHNQGVSREQLTVLTGYKRSSRDTYLHRLRSSGYLNDDGERIQATNGGLAVLGPGFSPLPTGTALREYWMERLPEGERRILEWVVQVYPEPMLRDSISEKTGYKRSSRDTYLQRLSARKLIVILRDGIKASDELF